MFIDTVASQHWRVGAPYCWAHSVSTPARSYSFKEPKVPEPGQQVTEAG